MKQFAVAILTLCLAVDVLGSLAPEMEEPRTTRRPSLPSSGEPEVYVVKENSGCCTYKPQKFNCNNMKYYFPRNIDCPYTGILFVTNKNDIFCANPSEKNLPGCVKKIPTYYIWKLNVKQGRTTRG